MCKAFIVKISLKYLKFSLYGAAFLTVVHVTLFEYYQQYINTYYNYFGVYCSDFIKQWTMQSILVTNDHLEQQIMCVNAPCSQVFLDLGVNSRSREGTKMKSITKTGIAEQKISFCCKNGTFSRPAHREGQTQQCYWSIIRQGTM